MRKQTWIRLLVLAVVILVVRWYVRDIQKPTSDVANIVPTQQDELSWVDTQAIEQEAEVNIPSRPVADVVDAEDDVETSTQWTLFTIADGSTIEWAWKKVGWQSKWTVNISQGDIRVSNDAIAGWKFTIDMESIRSTDPADSSLDDELKSPDYFNVQKHPTATFELLSAEAGSVQWVLTMNGVSKIIIFPATIIVEDDIVAVYAEFALDRTQWGVLGGKWVTSNYLELTLRLTWTS